jgi:hypothetical protein
MFFWATHPLDAAPIAFFPSQCAPELASPSGFLHNHTAAAATRSPIPITKKAIRRSPALQNLGARLLGRSFEIARIEPDQRLPGLHQLVVIDFDFLDCGRNTRADLVHVRRRVGVIGRFEIAQMQPLQEHADQNDRNDDPTHDQRFFRKMKFLFLLSGCRTISFTILHGSRPPVFRLIILRVCHRVEFLK